MSYEVKKKSAFIIFLIILCFVFPVLTKSETELTVSISVGYTTMTFTGRSSPNAQITITEGGVTAGTTLTDSSGLFSKSLLFQEPEVHDYSLYATDTNGTNTSTINYSVSLIAGTETTLSNIILPATVSISGTGIARGDALRIFGLAVPSSTITIFIIGTGTDINKTTTSDVNGSWEYSFDTSVLSVGSFYTYVKVSTTDGYQSESSENKNFEMHPAPTATPGLSTGIVTPTITDTAVLTPTPTPGLFSFLQPFDVDGNGKLEIAEVFDAMRIWVGLWRNNEGKTCDLNNDQICKFFDFSILLYYVER